VRRTSRGVSVITSTPARPVLARGSLPPPPPPPSSAARARTAHRVCKKRLVLFVCVLARVSSLVAWLHGLASWGGLIFFQKSIWWSFAVRSSQLVQA